MVAVVVDEGEGDLLARRREVAAWWSWGGVSMG